MFGTVRHSLGDYHVVEINNLAHSHCPSPPHPLSSYISSNSSLTSRVHLVSCPFKSNILKKFHPGTA